MSRFDKVAGADSIKIVDFGRAVFVAADARAPPNQPDGTEWKGCSSTQGYVAPFVSHHTITIISPSHQLTD